MDEIEVNDEVIPATEMNNDSAAPESYENPADANDSNFSIAPDLENLLNGVGITGESITLYADQLKVTDLDVMELEVAQLEKMEIKVTELENMEVRVTELLTQKPGEIPGDDLLATIIQESVTKPSKAGQSDSPPPGEAGQEVSGQPDWVREKYPELYSQWEEVSGDPISQGSSHILII